MEESKVHGRVCTNCGSTDAYGYTINYRSWCSISCYSDWDREHPRSLEIPKETKPIKKVKKKTTKKAKRKKKR